MEWIDLAQDKEKFRVLVNVVRTSLFHKVGSLGFFIELISPALGLIQPLKEMSTRGISWG
jgi:hypothetical protein